MIVKKATKLENHVPHPWIIVMGEKQMFCTNNDDHCLDHASYVDVHNGTKGVHVDLGIPVQIVTGSASCSEEHASFGSSQPWTIFRRIGHVETKS